MTDILELIDNAIDGNTSVDAMRWTPDGTTPEDEALARWVAAEPLDPSDTVTFTLAGISATFTIVDEAAEFGSMTDLYVPDRETDEFRQQFAAQVCAVFGVPPALVGVRLCGKHWHEYRRRVAEQAEQRVRLRRMHSAYHAKRR